LQHSLLIVFIIFFLTQTSYSQDTTKTLKLGVCGHITYNNIGDRNINPSIVANYGKSTYFIGPLLADNVDPAQKNYLVGLQTGYQIYPNGKGKVFSFFFEYDMNLLSSKIISDAADFYWYSSNSINKYNGTRHLEVFDFSHYISYGFNVHFLKQFYFSTSLGVGCGWYKKQFIWNAQTGETFNSGNDVATFDYLDGMLKVGLGYNFK
jgi:hypothetical protein